jgi:hypothetical protein
VTRAEREAVRVLILTAQQGEWVKGRCRRCDCERARGHKCSCPVKLAYKLLARVLGQPEPGIEDDDLIVESAMRDLVRVTKQETWQDQIPLWRRIVWEAVDAARHLGARR